MVFKYKQIGKFIPKLTLEVLDLSTVDNYNRTDITEALLTAVVFNEFSACKELIV